MNKEKLIEELNQYIHEHVHHSPEFIGADFEKLKELANSAIVDFIIKKINEKNP